MHIGKSKHCHSGVKRSSPGTITSNKNSLYQKEVDLTVQEEGKDTIYI